MERYFYMTIHFSPRYEETTLSQLEEGVYVDNETGDTYRKRPLFDFGWGQEDGFERMPPLPFDELIRLVEQPQIAIRRRFWKKPSKEEREQFSVRRDNLYGAVSVILQDHIEELIAFLAEKVDTDYFDDPVKRENFKLFSFDPTKDKEEGRIPSQVLPLTHEYVLNQYPQWQAIAGRVIAQIYR